MNPDVEIESNAPQRARELPAPLKALDKLAWNYWWSWAPDGPEIFRDLEPALWQQCELNPRALLAQVSDLRLAQIAADPSFAERVQQLSERFDAYMSDARPWPGLRIPSSVSRETPVAYFCAEYGVHSSLPLYSGGLGILAGDHLKSASDLNLPLVAVGLFYRFGYFRQSVTTDDWQDESYKEVYGDELALEVVTQNGAPVTIEVSMRGRVVRARAWLANIGRVQLYLLDTNLPDNDEVDRLITGHLYGGDRETRLVQEMMLGIGGVRLLRKLGKQPSVFHMNEGHSAFLSLELSSELIEKEKLNFTKAAERVRDRCVFTTHTPVAAGHDEFSPELIKEGFGDWYESALGLSFTEFLAQGRISGDAQEAFGLTPLALRMSRSTNGVSRKHGEVSRELWQKMWPERTVSEVPITSVTNGIHPSTWVASPIRSIYEKLFGDNWLEMARHASAWTVAAEKISDDELWQAHSLLKQRLVAFVRDRCFDARLARGDSNDHIEAARTMFDPSILTVGFARRIAGYKRWDLLLSDEERLTKLLNDSQRPIQFVLAGKAHPHDQGAKLILQKLLKWQRDPSVRHRVAFIEDYDQEVARQLVQGVDVWMNVPRRPYEASGTSGQKAAMNGVLNFSILDGWWLEGFDGTNGFAIGDTSELADADTDRRDAESLYRLLEEELIPTFYDRDEADLPRRWLAMMKRAIQTLVPAFDSDRMVAEYSERIY